MIKIQIEYANVILFFLWILGMWPSKYVALFLGFESGMSRFIVTFFGGLLLPVLVVVAVGCYVASQQTYTIRNENRSDEERKH